MVIELPKYMLIRSNTAELVTNADHFYARDAILPPFSGFPDFSSVQCENEILFFLF